MRTQILFEDGDILVCFKPAGLAVQSARVSEPDMESELKNYLARSGRTPGRRGPVYLGVVHRLDQPVSGLLVFAKNPRCAAALSAQSAQNRMEKIYRAAVMLPKGAAQNGLAPGWTAEYTDHLIREPGGMGRVADREEPGAKLARLTAVCLEAKEDRALLEIRLHTGRYHQIRLQLAHAGMPILGDERYGTPESRARSERIGVRGILLQAAHLAFVHPGTGKKVCYELEKKLELP